MYINTGADKLDETLEDDILNDTFCHTQSQFLKFTVREFKCEQDASIWFFSLH